MYKIVNFCPPSGVTSCPFDPILFFLAQTYGVWIRAITLSAIGFPYRRTDRLSQTVVSASSHGGQDRWGFFFSVVFLVCVVKLECFCVSIPLTASVKRVDNLYLPVKITLAA